MDLNFSFNFKEAVQTAKPIIDSNAIYDLIIIGGGPAGLNAALYAKRKGLKTAVITKHLGGQVKDTSVVENYLGTESESGEVLVEKFISHLNTLEVPILEGQMVVAYEKVSGVHRLTVEFGEVFQARTILLATGSTPRRLGIPGEKDFAGKGVAYCAICDGPLFTGKSVIVAGGGNSAVEAALDLSKIASEVKLVHRSQLRADQILIEELMKKENVSLYLETPIKTVLGDEKVTGIQTAEGSILSADGLFIEIGYVPNLGIFKDVVALSAKGEVLIDGHNQTNVPGIFAAGDVTDTPYKQIVIAAAEGAKAALAVNEYLQQNH